MAGVTKKSNPEIKKKIVVLPPPIQEEEEEIIDEPINNEIVEAVDKPEMVCVKRITNLPVVVSIMDVASSMYSKIRSCSCVTHCLCKSAEKTAKSALYVAESFNSCSILQCPIRTFDSAVCLGLDVVESVVPGVKLPPEEMYSNTKDYVIGMSKRIGQYPRNLFTNVKQYGTNTMADVQSVSSCTKKAVDDVVTVISTTAKDGTHQITQEESRNWKSERKLNEILPIFKSLSVLLSITFRYLPSRLFEGNNERGREEVEGCTVLKLEFEMLIEAIRTCDCCKNRKPIPQLSDIPLNPISTSSSSTTLSAESTSDDADI